MKLRIAIGFVALFAVSAQSQQRGAEVHSQAAADAPKLRVRTRVLGTSTPKAVRGPSDRMWIDSNGDVVAEGAVLPDGRAFEFHITRRIHIKPSATVLIGATADGYEYRYRITNGVSAKQWIARFWLDVYGQVGKVVVPPYWHLYGVRRRWDGVSRIHIARLAKDYDERERLVPGATAGEFTVAAARRPGLVRLSAQGEKPFPRPGEPGDEGYEQFAGTMSDWLRAEINKALSVENNSVIVYTLGPKFPPDIAGLDAVRSELLLAGRLAVFDDDRKILLETAAMTDTASIQSRLRELQAKASGLPAQFYSTMLSYLP